MKKIIPLFLLLLTFIPTPSAAADNYFSTEKEETHPRLLAMADLDEQVNEAKPTAGTSGMSSRSMEEMLLFFDEEELLVTATKHPQKLSEAPAIATIITAEQIRNMGARDLMDVLRRVPGVGVLKGHYGKEEIEVRGIKTLNSEQVKLLIDGHSVNDNVTGGATWSFDSLSLDNVKRIEIIRGPGSALYGSNAFSSIINIVTKNGADIDGVVVSAGSGNFDTSKLTIQVGEKKNDLDIAFSMVYFETDGAHLKVAGQAGETKDYEDKIDTTLKLSYKDISFKSKYVIREKGAYIGPTYALTDESEIETEQFFAELSYKHYLKKNLSLLGKLFIDQFDWDAYWELFPEGTILPSGAFPDGMIGNPRLTERALGAELQLDYRLHERNMLTVGALKEERKQFDIEHKANFDPITFAPIGPIQDVALWNQNKKREIWAAYIQDVWDVAEEVNLTMGIRHDDYSDFGSTTNPRAGIVWEFSKDWDAKLLYGTAFRAPSFVELYNDNNLVENGNLNLSAEKVKTYEVSLGHSYGEKSHGRLTYFNNRFKDKIQLVNGQFENTGGARVWGLEMEWNQNFSRSVHSYINYTYQKPEDIDNGDRIADVPSHKGNVGFHYSIGNNINFNTNVFISGKRPRAVTDPRSDAPSYTLVDIALIGKNFFRSLELRGSVHNLFDKEYADSAPAGKIAGDLPREGISFMLEGIYKF